MAIAKKPNRNQSTAKPAENKAKRFIAGAEKSEPVEARKTPTTLRFDPQLLARIDAAAKRRGVSRSAWIQYKLSQALDEEGL